ncbi:hypothetical protein [Undibacterium sp. TJN19]|uniref:hypothetical protein n=1 Tax=Undibacterium sp. TJN19 TaxID=3413055 RepID=UPI003BF1E135
MSARSTRNRPCQSKIMASIMHTTINSLIHEAAANKKTQTAFNKDAQRKGIFARSEYDLYEADDYFTESPTRNKNDMRRPMDVDDEDFQDEDLYIFLDEDYQDDLHLSDAVISDDNGEAIDVDFLQL